MERLEEIRMSMRSTNYSENIYAINLMEKLCEVQGNDLSKMLYLHGPGDNYAEYVMEQPPVNRYKIHDKWLKYLKIGANGRIQRWRT